MKHSDSIRCCVCAANRDRASAALTVSVFVSVMMLSIACLSDAYAIEALASAAGTESGPTPKANSFSMSWAANALQDTLEVSGTGELDCYLIGDFSDGPQVFGSVVANWYFPPGTTLISVEGFLSAAPSDIEITDMGNGLFTILIDYSAQCEVLDTLRAVAKFRVHVDPHEQGAGATYGIGVIPDANTPQVLLRNSACLSAGVLQVSIGAIFVANSTVPNGETSWGSFRAMYRQSTQ